MSERLLTEISAKLDKLIKLQALVFVKDIQNDQDKIRILDSMGFRPTEIASLLDKTPHNISVVLSNMRKKEKNTATANGPTSTPEGSGPAQPGETLSP